MSVNIQFQANQTYQLDAIDAVTNLFDGWQDGVSHESTFVVKDDLDALFAESIVANPWGVTQDQLLSNVLKIQAAHRTDSAGTETPVIPLDLRIDESQPLDLRDFSVEMETGTGKTYVYLRTAIELYLRFGLAKFVVVVPSLAIREGVLASLKLLKEHFSEIYSGLQYDAYGYDSKNLSRLRQFAVSGHLQILVMNIQSFNKDSNVINKEDEYGRRPVDYITGVRPIVIMDEPQKLDAQIQKAAIQSLQPLFRLRYSATHKDRHCLIYRLSPVDAYQMELVKQIQVLSLVADEDKNVPYVELISVNSTKSGVTASLRVNKAHARVKISVARNDDLNELTGLEIYRGWVIEEIHASLDDQVGWVEFTNGQRISVGTSNETDQDWWQRAQIRAAVEEHFRTELRIKNGVANSEILPMKVLTLFFIDKVANYANHDSKFRIWFETIYNDIANDRRFRNLDVAKASESHAGYFAQSRGQAKDSREGFDSQDDSDVYDLIMKDKERLLSLDEPVRFIFSHSALQEGWDNPNVFVICNLQASQTVTKRRQQLGRGLRLPVMADGNRCQSRSFNVLTVVASEEFESFASGLQKELVEETGEQFATPIMDARQRTSLKLKPNFSAMPGFQELWNAISPKTRYRLSFDSQDLIDEAVLRFQNEGKLNPISTPKIRMSRSKISIDRTGGVAMSENVGTRSLATTSLGDVPDILRDLSQQLAVSRSTILSVILQSGRLPELQLDPSEFAKQVRKSVQHSLAGTLASAGGIQYSPTSESYDAEFFEKFDEPETYTSKLVKVTKSIYEEIPVDSNIERQFAKDLDLRSDVKLFLKLPSWYKIPTPVGNYNPDWAVVKQDDESGLLELYLVRETKGSASLDDLFRESELWKVTFGKAHFDAINVDYKVVKDASDLDSDESPTLE